LPEQRRSLIELLELADADKVEGEGTKLPQTPVKEDTVPLNVLQIKEIERALLVLAKNVKVLIDSETYRNLPSKVRKEIPTTQALRMAAEIKIFLDGKIDSEEIISRLRSISHVEEPPPGTVQDRIRIIFEEASLKARRQIDNIRKIIKSDPKSPYIFFNDDKFVHDTMALFENLAEVDWANDFLRQNETSCERLSGTLEK